MTPEGRVKEKIKKVLDIYRDRVYVFMPVPNGYGKTTVDYLGIFHGLGFAIEAKRPGKRPTSKQLAVLEEVVAAGGVSFAVSDDEELQAFADWLYMIDQQVREAQ